MLGPRVHLELAELLSREPVAGEHPLDRLADHFLGALLEQVAQGAEANAAGIAAVPPVALVLALLAGHSDLLGVDDDHEVPDVDVRRVGRLALPAENVRDLGRQAAERPALGVDQVPVPLAVLGSRLVGLHRCRRSHKKEPRTDPRPADDSAGRIGAVEGDRLAASASYEEVTKRYPERSSRPSSLRLLRVLAWRLAILPRQQRPNPS